MGAERPTGPRRARVALLCAAWLLSANAVAVVSGSSDIWRVELVGTASDCDGCERNFKLRATGPYGKIQTFHLAARGAAAVDDIHVWGNRAIIVQSFAESSVRRIALYALPSSLNAPRPRPGYLAHDLLAAEFSVSPDGRYVLFRPARAPGEALDRRLFLWDVLTRMPGAPTPRRTECGGLKAPCPPNPRLHVLVFPRPPSPSTEEVGVPAPHPLRTVWDQREEDPNVIRSAEDRLEFRHMDLDRLAFVALDRREWLTLVVVALDGADSAIDCYLPIVPHWRDSGDGGALSEKVRSFELGPKGAVVEMYGNSGVGAVHTVPMRGTACRSEREHWEQAHHDLNLLRE